jgi:hypothetical protein
MSTRPCPTARRSPSTTPGTCAASTRTTPPSRRRSRRPTRPWRRWRRAAAARHVGGHPRDVARRPVVADGGDVARAAPTPRSRPAPTRGRGRRGGATAAPPRGWRAGAPRWRSCAPSCSRSRPRRWRRSRPSGRRCALRPVPRPPRDRPPLHARRRGRGRLGRARRADAAVRARPQHARRERAALRPVHRRGRARGRSVDHPRARVRPGPRGPAAGLEPLRGRLPGRARHPRRALPGDGAGHLRRGAGARLRLGRGARAGPAPRRGGRPGRHAGGVHAPLPVWHRYWEARRRLVGVARLEPWDVFAPLGDAVPRVPYERAAAWIVDSSEPLGEAYQAHLRRGLLEERWVDKPANAASATAPSAPATPGAPHPFVFVSYTDDMSAASTLAHEFGHAIHAVLSDAEQDPLDGVERAVDDGRRDGLERSAGAHARAPASRARRRPTPTWSWRSSTRPCSTSTATSS